MTVIVYGHVTRAVPLTPPIYPKQLGVALFLFASGFTLARERRPAAEALLKRLAQLWVYAFVFAAAVTAVGAVNGSGLALSNYLPLAAGANVVFDNFPANPTTWYIGTYIHIVVLWALWLRRVRVRMWMVAAALAIEIPIRALLVATAGSYVAYMLFTNWAAVFLLGMARGSRGEDEPAGSAVPYIAAGIAGVLVWGVATTRLFAFDTTIPFMTLRGWPTGAGLLAASAAVSALYVSAAAIVFEATRRLSAPAIVRFVARNTTVIFIAHMPVVFALHPRLVAWHVGYAGRVIVQMAVCLVGLGCVSEAIRWLLDRSSTYAALMRLSRRGDAAAASAPLMGLSR